MKHPLLVAALLLGDLLPIAGATWTGLLVPAYFPPARVEAWNQLAVSAGQVPVMAIANVFNGPGTAMRPEYRQVIDSVRAAGGRVIGYVHTTYTRRAASEVTADIDRWGQFYALDGIFVDEMTNDADPAHLAYYRSLRDHARGRHPGWLIVGNPGTSTREVYLTEGTADLLVTFENGQGYLTHSVEAWTRRHDREAFCHLAYSLTDAPSMTNYVRLARQRGAGWVYFTDDTLPNPWDRLPTWWVPMTEHLRALNANEPIRLAVAGAPPDSIQVRVESVPGPVTLESSSDLVGWEPLTVVVARAGEAEVRVTTAGQARRYVRARR